jgi:hypothetical protein
MLGGHAWIRVLLSSCSLGVSGEDSSVKVCRNIHLKWAWCMLEGPREGHLKMGPALACMGVGATGPRTPKHPDVKER